MKQVKIWSMMMLFAMMISLLVSCGSDGDDEGGQTVDVAKVAGTWYCTQSTDNSNGKTYSNLFKGESVTIYTNGTYTSTSSNFGTKGKFVVDGNKIIVTTNSGRIFTVTVFLNGDTMTWKGSGEGITFTYTFNREDSASASFYPYWGNWICVSSIDKVNGETKTDLFKGVTVEIYPNGTYTSSSKTLGYYGTYTANGNKVTATNDSGQVFSIDINVQNDQMTWNGTSSSGVVFEYFFNKRQSGL